MMSWLFAPFFLFANSMDIEILGTWDYIGYSYGGQTYPKTDSELELRFSFYENNKSTLRWIYHDTGIFCERMAEYKIIHRRSLSQKVIATNANNDSSCDKDPDMRVGSESLNEYKIENNVLYLTLNLSGEPLIYILNRVSDAPKFRRKK